MRLHVGFGLNGLESCAIQSMLFDELLMQRIIGTFVMILVVASPVWTTTITLMLPRRMFGLSAAICALQLLLAYLIWWFFWGGGIGVEADLSPVWQLTLASALAPALVTALKRWRRA